MRVASGKTNGVASSIDMRKGTKFDEHENLCCKFETTQQVRSAANSCLKEELRRSGRRRRRRRNFTGRQQVINLVVVVRQMSVIFILLTFSQQQQQPLQSSLCIFSLAQEAANDEETARVHPELQNHAAQMQHKSFNSIQLSANLSADEQQPAVNGNDPSKTTSPNFDFNFEPDSNFTSETVAASTRSEMGTDDLSVSESRASGEQYDDRRSSAPSARGRHLRRLLARSGLFLSSIVPQTTPFSKQLVLENPRQPAIFASGTVGRRPSFGADHEFRVPRRILTTIPIPRERPTVERPQLAAARANSLLVMQPHLELNKNQQQLMIGGPPPLAQLEVSPPAGMFDDDEDEDDNERQLDQIDQLIKAEYETRLSLNEHIVRNPNQFRRLQPPPPPPPPPIGQFNGTSVVTLNGYSDPLSSATTANSLTGETTTTTTTTTTLELGDQQQFSEHTNGPKSVEVGFRPVLLHRGKASNSTRLNHDRSEISQPPATINEPRKLSSFVPTDPETIAQLKQKTGDERILSSNNSASSLLSPTHTNRIRAAQSSPVSQSSPKQQQQQQQQNPFIRSKQTGLVMKENFMDQPASNRRPASLSFQQPPPRLNAGPVGLALADSSNIQHQMNANQKFQHHQIEQQHSINTLSETLKRLRETKARIRQLQTELNATDPLLLLLEPPGRAVNMSRAAPHRQQSSSMAAELATRQNQAKMYSQLETIGVGAEVSSPGRHLALSGGTPLRAQPALRAVYPSTNPLTAPARLMVSALGRAAQTAIATQRLPNDFLGWPSLSTTSGRIPLLLLGSNTTSAPITLSSSISVASSTTPTMTTTDYPATTANPFDDSQLPKPVDLSAFAAQATTPAAASATSAAVGAGSRLTSAQNDDYATKVTNKEQNNNNNLQIIGSSSSSSSQTNRSSPPFIAAGSSTEAQATVSADNRIDARFIKLPANSDDDNDDQSSRHQPNKHANETYQFRYQERPRATTTTTTTTTTVKPDKRREEQSKDDSMPSWPPSNSNRNHHSESASSEPTKPLITDTIDRMSSGADSNDRQSVADNNNNNNSSSTRAASNSGSIGQTLYKILDQTGQVIVKLFNLGWKPIQLTQEAETRLARPPTKPTTERVLFVLITFICSLALVCVLAVFAAVRCQARKAVRSIGPAGGESGEDSAAIGPRLDWRKLVTSSAQEDRFRREKLILDGTMRNVSLLARQHHQTGAKKQVEKKRIQQQQQLNNLPAPMFKQSCCHCVACAESWLFRNDDAVNNSSNNNNNENNKPQHLCSSGFYHPVPRGKLPFGAASSVNKLIGSGDSDRAAPATSAKSREAASLSPPAAAAAAVAAQFGRNPIGGTRLRMMSAIDEQRQQQQQQHDQCSCEPIQLRNWEHKKLVRPIVNAAFEKQNANVGPEQKKQTDDSNDKPLKSTGLSGQQQQDDGDDDDDDDDGYLCNCCHGDRNVNMSDPINERPQLRLLDRESLGGFELAAGQLGRRRPTNCQPDSINIISRARVKTTTSAQTAAANCESNGSSSSAAAGNSSNNKCNGQFRAKISASRLELARRESEDELDDDDDDDGRADYQDAHLRGAKGVLSSQLPLPSVAIRQQQQQQHQRCLRASGLSVECLHNHSAAADLLDCNQAGEHQSLAAGSAPTASSSQLEKLNKLNKYKLTDEQRQQQQQQREHWQQQH